MIRRPPRSTPLYSSAASDVYKRQARHSSSGRQPNFAALNRGRHLYLEGRPSRWALAHILVLSLFSLLLTMVRYVSDRLCRVNNNVSSYCAAITAGCMKARGFTGRLYHKQLVRLDLNNIALSASTIRPPAARDGCDAIEVRGSSMGRRLRQSSALSLSRQMLPAVNIQTMMVLG